MKQNEKYKHAVGGTGSDVYICTEPLDTICLYRVIRDFRTTSNDAVALKVLDCMCVLVCSKPQGTRVRRQFLWLEPQLVYVRKGEAPACVCRCSTLNIANKIQLWRKTNAVTRYIQVHAYRCGSSYSTMTGKHRHTDRNMSMKSELV